MTIKKSAGKKSTNNPLPKTKVPLTIGRKELLVDGSDNMFREMIHNSLAFSVRLEAIRDGFAKYIGLTGIQYTILISIAHLDTEKQVGVSEVAKHLSLSGTFVTTETRKLVNMGLITKEVDKDDKRRVSLKLTPLAEKSLEELSTIQSDINDMHFEPLTKGDFQRFTFLMKELTLSTDRALVTLEHHLRLRETEQ